MEFNKKNYVYPKNSSYYDCEWTKRPYNLYFFSFLNLIATQITVTAQRLICVPKPHCNLKPILVHPSILKILMLPFISNLNISLWENHKCKMYVLHMLHVNTIDVVHYVKPCFFKDILCSHSYCFCDSVGSCVVSVSSYQKTTPQRKINGIGIRKGRLLSGK